VAVSENARQLWCCVRGLGVAAQHVANRLDTFLPVLLYVPSHAPQTLKGSADQGLWGAKAVCVEGYAVLLCAVVQRGAALGFVVLFPLLIMCAAPHTACFSRRIGRGRQLSGLCLTCIALYRRVLSDAAHPARWLHGFGAFPVWCVYT
jgi:hypothetical protein